MQHYLVETKDLGTLESAYPHSPANDNQSIQDYLEDRLSDGFELVSMAWYDTGYMYFIFRVVGK